MTETEIEISAGNLAYQIKEAKKLAVEFELGSAAVVILAAALHIGSAIDGVMCELHELNREREE